MHSTVRQCPCNRASDTRSLDLQRRWQVGWSNREPPPQASFYHIGKSGFHFRIDESGVYLLVKSVDDRGGRVHGCADPVPNARLVARYKFAYGRNIWQRCRARRAGDGKARTLLVRMYSMS
jgi:hypothetical protein